MKKKHYSPGDVFKKDDGTVVVIVTSYYLDYGGPNYTKDEFEVIELNGKLFDHHCWMCPSQLGTYIGNIQNLV